MGLWNLNMIIDKPEFETQIQASESKCISLPNIHAHILCLVVFKLGS